MTRLDYHDYHYCVITVLYDDNYHTVTRQYDDYNIVTNPNVKLLEHRYLHVVRGLHNWTYYMGFVECRMGGTVGKTWHSVTMDTLDAHIGSAKHHLTPKALNCFIKTMETKGFYSI